MQFKPSETNAAGMDEVLFKTDGIQYQANDKNLKRAYQSVFNNTKELKRVPFELNAGTGKIITKILLKKDNQVLQTINVNAQSYNDFIKSQGEPVAVKSVGNVANGSWFAWNRSIAGTTWVPGLESTITSLVEKDLARAINRHLELVKRMGLSIQFTLPRGLQEQSIQDVGIMAFIQGYPLPGGELLDAYSLGSGAVMRRKVLIGTRNSAGRHIAYGESCVPSGVTVIESLFDPEEAARKGYFIEDCAVR